MADHTIIDHDGRVYADTAALNQRGRFTVTHLGWGDFRVLLPQMEGHAPQLSIDFIRADGTAAERALVETGHAWSGRIHEVRGTAEAIAAWRALIEEGA